MQQWLENIGKVDWGQAVLIFILGIVTVFLVLIILWTVLAIMKVVFSKANNEVSAPKTDTPHKAVKSEKKMSAPKVVATAPPANEDELIAILNGAVAAYADSTSLRVKSYKKM